MNIQEIQKAINSFPVWHYEFDLLGLKTPIFRQDLINRHSQRKHYFFDPLVEFLGGSLKGKRVLDIGCNAGYWTLQAIQRDCDFALGIDGRQVHIDQANFVFDVHGISSDRYKFIKGDLYDIDFSSLGQFDIVFCLGLLYHINRPIQLLENIEKVSPEILIIDTYLSSKPGSVLEIIHEDTDVLRNAVSGELVYHPSMRAVVDLVQYFNYECITLKPDFTSYEGAEVYLNNTRKAFICSKSGNLSKFPAETEDVNVPYQKNGFWGKLKKKLKLRYPTK